MDEERKSAVLRFKIDDRWVELSESQIFKHPGGSVINQYSGSDATHIFHAFHSGSEKAFKQLNAVKKNQTLSEIESKELEASIAKRTDEADINISAYDISIEQEKKIVASFEKLRAEVTRRGWLEGAPLYCCWKMVETFLLLAIVLGLQYHGWYVTSAFTLGLLWQQYAWLAHDLGHNQPFKNRETCESLALVFSGTAQGLSRDWWKEKHNTHHAATNVIEHDTDIDFAPYVSLIPDDLKKYKLPIEKFLLKFVPYQHIYFTPLFLLMRFSWTVQSLQFVFSEQNSNYRVHRRNALGEQVALLAHWVLVATQLYYLPDNSTRLWYFLVSQAFAGFLLGNQFTFSHNSVDKYPADSRIMNNFACLQILTTRNMRPSRFVDWFWGGLNYQIEHHLFPTMPRCHFNECSKLVKAFCKENGLEYLVDDFTTGYGYNLQQLQRIGELAEQQAQAVNTMG